MIVTIIGIMAAILVALACITAIGIKINNIEDRIVKLERQIKGA